MTDNNEMKNGDKPAFAWIDHPDAQGLSKRELFAAMIAQGLAANAEAFQSNISQEAVLLADELIAELEASDAL